MRPFLAFSLFIPAMFICAIFCAIFMVFPQFSAQAQLIRIKTSCVPAGAGNADSDDTGVAGAGYIPGVDVEGNPVAPADLGGALPTGLEYPLEIPIEIDVIEWLGISVSQKVKDAALTRPKMTSVTVYEDGRIEYDGHDLGERAKLVCADELEVREPEAAQEQEAGRAAEKKPDGLHSSDALPSAIDSFDGEVLEGQSP